MTPGTPSRFPRPAERPARIGAYRVLEEVGRGAQGVVYLGQDAAGQAVAIKAIRPEHAADSPAARRLRQEGEFLSVLNHPHIARVYEPVVEAERLFVVMEYVEGQQLSERLRFGALPRNEGLAICRQIALAVEAAHVAQMVHRDLKPSNIRITPDGVVKVLDFGVAIQAGSQGTAGSVVGTFGYMSPEQMMGGEVDHRADTWSFGCILYECLTGHPLYPPGTFEQTFLRVACRDADLSRLPGDLPRRLRVMLKSCLVRHPGGRLGSIAEAVAAIDWVLNKRLPIGQRPTEHTNLPRRTSSFVGRERELSLVASQLRNASGVCITGPGGAGKTRLAQEIGLRLLREFRDGVWFLDLSERDPTESLAELVRAAIPGPVISKRPLGGSPAETASDEERLAHQIGTLQALLVIDQCDFFVDAFRRLCAEVQQRCPHVRLLCTSRENPQSPGCSVCALTPLEVPGPTSTRTLEDLLRVESVRLFVDRARAVERAYAPTSDEAAAIAELCLRVDGLPLSVELAGARAGVMGPGAMLERLDEILRAPAPAPWTQAAGGARPRHATLDACIRWSFDLLGAMEQAVLERASVFKGGWTLDAARAVCAGGPGSIESEAVRLSLTRLVNKSLVSYDAQSGRYSMLESVRGFLHDRQTPAELRRLRVQHFEYFFGFAEKTAKGILSGEQARSLRAMQADYENIRAALDAVDLAEIARDRFLALAVQLHKYCYTRGHFKEARQMLRAGLERAPDASPLLRCQAVNSLGMMAFGLEQFEDALSEFRAGLEIIQATGTPVQICSCWENIALVFSTQGRNDEAEAAYRHAMELATAGHSQDFARRTRLGLAYHKIKRGDYAEAERLARGVYEELEGSAENKLRAIALHNIGEVRYFQVRDAEAMNFFTESIRLKDEIGDRRGLSLSVYMYALSALREGFPAQAVALMAKSLEIRAEIGIDTLPMPKPDHDAAVQRMMAELGPDGFTSAWNRGRELYDEEAVQTITTGL